ncbi:MULTISPECIES: cytochrome P450 [Actinosynnema]|uniref:cytochrome P450 n=1 Tax=Actinosynnema TaxID=40566 RepID=UPI0020A370E1|nr:cytochrome P450 [Actinosynnema pretiosum]MCP2094901.1 Cytochrome P450 [Actinosynnema pretiosum]
MDRAVRASTAVRALAAAAAVSAPRWLPQRVVALRGKVFEKVNGDRVLTLPDERHGPEVFERVYADPAADGRSRGAGLSDLFWYWLAPGPEVHQEHLEPGPRYEDVARFTRAMVSGPSGPLAEAATRATAAALDALPHGRVSLVRLRDLMMPVWAEYFYGLVFGEPCPPRARDLIVGHADDVVTALKCTGLRNMRRRARLTRYLRRRVAAGDVVRPLPDSLGPEEKVHFLQGTFFNTAVVQMSEGMAHLLLAIARRPEVQARLVAEPEDDRYLGHVLDEVLRLYPLFGIAHRITSGEVRLGPGEVLPAGSVVCFSYPEYHATGYERPDEFVPERWESLSAREAHHIPFGVAANRPCPAWRIAPLAMKAATREVLRRYRLDSPVSHTRSIPHRAPCLLVPRDAPRRPGRVAALRGFLRVRDRWEDVARSLVQLVLGTVMVLDARRLRLAGRYFDALDAAGVGPGDPAAPDARTPHRTGSPARRPSP